MLQEKYDVKYKQITISSIYKHRNWKVTGLPTTSFCHLNSTDDPDISWDTGLTFTVVLLSHLCVSTLLAPNSTDDAFLQEKAGFTQDKKLNSIEKKICILNKVSRPN